MKGSRTSWKLSRSPVTMTTSDRRSAASVASVAMTSSASKPGASTTGTASAPMTSRMMSNCGGSSQGVSARPAL